MARVEPIASFDLRLEDFFAVIDGMQMDVATDIRAPDRATLDLFTVPIEEAQDSGIGLTAHADPVEIAIKQTCPLILPVSKSVGAEDLVQTMTMQGAATATALIVPVKDGLGLEGCLRRPPPLFGQDKIG